MILYILFIVLAVLLTLTALGFTLYGALKKRKKMFGISLASFVVMTLVSVFAIYTYIGEQIAYMNSDEFGEETRMIGQNVGKKLGNTITGTLEGLDETLDEDVIASMSEKGSRIIGKGVEASAKGFDETTGKTTVYLDETAGKMGVSIGRAERLTDSIKASYGLYLEFKDDFNKKLKLTAFDSEGKKMDNAILEVSASANSEKVYVFAFDYFNPGLSGHCVLSAID